MRHYICLLSFLCLCQVLTAQCYPDRHNTTWHDAWISCDTKASPNAARGESHWLHYDLGHLYKLKSSEIWNANEPKSLANGLQNIVIDYSIDGENWTELGAFVVPQADGTNTYEGAAGPYFGEVVARYVLITAIDNYGGKCFSLSEVKIDVEEAPVATTELTPANFEVFPNPVATILYIKLPEGIEAPIGFEIIDALGKRLKTISVTDSGIGTASVDVQDIPSGIYFLQAIGESVKGSVRFVKE